MKRIAFITDVHLDEQFPIDNNVNPAKNLEIVLADLAKQEITDLVVGGDIGEASAHAYFFKALSQFTFNLILGNHDKFDIVKDHFNADLTKNELYYKVEEEQFDYLFLDTSADELSDNQLQWLQAQLNNSKEILVFVHHPILPIDTPVDKLYPLINREQLLAIFLNHKKRVTVFCGHYHMNDEQEYKNIKQYTTQSLSFQLVKEAAEIQIDNTSFGYRIIEVNGATLETQLITFDSTTN
jgi:3',5'-cyclic-AMP phosphodiesterase